MNPFFDIGKIHSEMSSSLKQCTITSEKSHIQIWRERLSISKRMYCTLVKNTAKFSFDNFITSFCKMVAVATEICVKGLYLCRHTSMCGRLFICLSCSCRPMISHIEQSLSPSPSHFSVFFFLGLAGA